MKIYAIADLHLSFCDDIDKPMSVFGEGWEDYENRLSSYWDEMLDDDDVMMLPGDLSWGLKLEEAIPDLEWIHERKGKKVLLKGNHDLWWTGITRLNEMFSDMYFLQNTCYYIGDEDVAIAGSRGWELPGSDDYSEHDEKIYIRELGRLESSLKAASETGASRIIAMMHYPPADDRKRKSDFTELLESYNVWKCVYGHLHGQIAFGKGIKGTENGIEYDLISLDYIGARPKLIYNGGE